MRRISGGLGFVSERVGVRRHAVAACIAGLVVLLTGCLHDEGKTEVVQVNCTNLNQKGELFGVKDAQSYLTYYYSDGTRDLKASPLKCWDK